MTRLFCSHMFEDGGVQKKIEELKKKYGITDKIQQEKIPCEAVYHVNQYSQTTTLK